MNREFEEKLERIKAAAPTLGTREALELAILVLEYNYDPFEANGETEGAWLEVQKVAGAAKALRDLLGRLGT